MKDFTKHDAVRLWIGEHHPHLAVRVKQENFRLGFLVIGRDADLLQQMGESVEKEPPKYGEISVVEINFDIDDAHNDWFFNHNSKPTNENHCITVSIKDPTYFEKLEQMLTYAKVL